MTMSRGVVMTIVWTVGLAGCSSTSPSNDAMASSAGVPSEAPSHQAISLGEGTQELDAGTYRLDLTSLASAADPYPAFEMTVREGWVAVDGWALNRPAARQDAPAVAVTFWDVKEVYGDPCAWSDTVADPGPAVEDLVSALVEVPMRNATEPVAVEIDGRSGTYLEWSVPTDIAFVEDNGDFPDCDLTNDGHRDFRSWTGTGWSTDRYHQGPGQVDRLWILDVDGERLVIDAFSMPSASPEEVEELVGVVASIRFVDG